MSSNRRSFLKGTAVGVVSASSAGALVAPAAAQTPHSFEMPRGMTLINMRRDGAHRLGVKMDKGVLDVTAAAQALNLPAPTDMAGATHEIIQPVGTACTHHSRLPVCDAPAC